MALIINEPGFYYNIVIPDTFLSFRLEDCRQYKTVSGRGFKEMEAGWLTASPIVYLMELKAWYDPRNPFHQEKNIPEDHTATSTQVYVRDQLVNKVVDVLYLLTQNKPLINVKDCVDKQIINHLAEGKKIVLLFIIGARQGYNLTPVKTAFCKELKTRLESVNLQYAIPNDCILFIDRENFEKKYAKQFGLSTAGK
jgi:hypothetical protein